jgi:hypothetical protein
VSLIKAQRVIEATQDSAPGHTRFILTRACFPQDPSAEALADWQERSARALTSLYPSVDDPALLSIENLEAWDPEFFAPVLDALP